METKYMDLFERNFCDVGTSKEENTDKGMLTVQVDNIRNAVVCQFI